ncbi:MAG: hypothetical protein IKC41_07805, partial [Clostridia bacterium]|nr:hypothetical protein [Clostridia bacterium]
MLKKIISIVLTMMLVVSCSFTALAWTELSDASDTNIVRIGVMSDTHQEFTGLTTAANTYYALDSSLDGLILAGDIIYMEDTVDIDLYDELLATTVGPERKTIGTLLEEDFISYAMGNHEAPLGSDAATMETCAEGFTAKTGEEINSVKTFGGYRVISISPDDSAGNYSDETADFLKTQIDAALEETTGPVFINTHFGFHQTVLGTDTWGSSCAKFSDEKLSIIEEIKQNPRIIAVSGHTHKSSYDPRSIYQEENGFTAVQNSLISGSTAPYSEGLLLEINKTTNNVKIKRIDFNTGTEIGQPWTINTDGSNQLYTDAAREAAAQAPVFPEGATVTVDPYENAALIYVTAATKFAESETDFAHSYRVTYTNNTTGASASKTYTSDFYRATQADTLEFRLDGLTGGTEYSLSVCAISPYSKTSAPVTLASFKTDDVEFEDVVLKNVVTKSIGEEKSTNATTKYSSFYAFGGTSYIEFEFNIATADYYRISATMGAGNTKPTAKLFIDNNEICEREIMVGSWGMPGQSNKCESVIWADHYLTVGTHTIKIQRTTTGGSGSYILDSVSVGRITDEAASSNLIPDGDFEDYNETTAMITSPTTSQFAVSSAAAGSAHTKVVDQNGNKVLQLGSTSTKAQYIASSVKWEAGKTYTISLNAYVTSAAAGTKPKVTVTLSNLNTRLEVGNGTTGKEDGLTTERGSTSTKFNTPFGKWYHLEAVVNPTATSTRSLKIELAATAATSEIMGYIDNVVIEEYVEPTEYNVTITGENAVTSVSAATSTGDAVNFTAKPKFGYYIQSITIGGTPFTGFDAYKGGTYSTGAIEADTAIVVTTAALSANTEVGVSTAVATLPAVFAEAGEAPVTFGKVLADVATVDEFGIYLTKGGEGVTSAKTEMGPHFKAFYNVNGQYAIEFQGLAA